MSNENQPQETKSSTESELLGVSIRAWTLLILVTTVCVMSVIGIEVKEPLYTLVGLAVGFYFGQKTQGGRREL